MTIADRIDELIIQLGISKYDVAKALDITPQSVYNWFKPIGPTSPTLENLIKFLEFYDISPSEFLNGFNIPTLTDKQKDLLTTWSKLTNQEKETLLPLIQMLANKSEQK